MERKSTGLEGDEQHSIFIFHIIFKVKCILVFKE